LTAAEKKNPEVHVQDYAMQPHDELLSSTAMIAFASAKIARRGPRPRFTLEGAR
jgi:hypothetical protein